MVKANLSVTSRQQIINGNTWNIFRVFHAFENGIER